MRFDGSDPFVRATVRDGRLTLNAWTPMLLRGGGPGGVRIETCRVALVDLTLSAEGTELVAAPVPRTAWDDAAADTLIAWAQTVGYRRLWLPDRVVELDPPPVRGLAVVTCPACGTEWEDATADFWAGVCRAGHFPGTCLACGGSLPEWTVELHDEDDEAGEPADAPTEVRT